MSVAVLLFFAFANFQAFQSLLNIKTHYSLEQFQPKAHPLLQADKKVKERFKIKDGLNYLVLLEAAPKYKWTSTAYLKELDLLTKKILKFEEVLSVHSLSNIDTAITDEKSFTVGRIQDISSDPKERAKILKNPLITPHFISEDGSYASLIISAKSLSFKHQADFVRKIEKSVNEKGWLYKGQVGGPTAISSQIADLLDKEIALYSLLSLLISALVLAVIFKYLSTVFISLLIVISANTICLGIMSYFGMSLTVLSGTVPILVSLTVVSLLTQTLSRLADYKNKVLEKHRHIIALKIVRQLAPTHLLATVTPAIGFATLMSSEIPLISSYGLSVVVGIMTAYAVTIGMMSALLVWVAIPAKRKFAFDAGQVSRWIVKNDKALFTGVVSMAICMALLGKNLNWSTLLFDDLPAEHSVRQATTNAEKYLGGAIPLEISITANTTDAWKKPENLSKLDSLTDTWRRKPGVGAVVSLSDFIEQAHPERRIASTQQALSETYFVYSMANENPVDSFLTTDGKSARATFRLNDISSTETQSMIAEFKSQAAKEFPAMKVEVSGLAAIIHPINENLSRQLIFGFYEAMLWIMLLLAVVFRSPRWAIVSAIPNLVPPALLLGLLALSNTPIKPSIAIIFAISLGLAFNNTVYILMKFKKLMKEHGEISVEALMSEELGPCFTASLTSMAGFSIFLFSYFGMNQIFGTFMVLSVAAGLLGDLVLLPAMLSLFPGLLRTKSSDETLIGKLRYTLMTPKAQKITLSVLFLLLTVLFLARPTFAAGESATDILKKVEKGYMSPNEQVELKMQIVESDGSKKEHTLQIKKKSAKDQKAMVRLLSPSDLKGVALLSVNSGGKDEDQWLYLPSEKRSRRIVGSNKKGRFLNSELSYEDLRASTYDNFNNKVTENKNGTAIIESTAKDGAETSYTKIKTWVNTKDYRLVKAEYYDDAGLLKVMTFNNYKKYKNLWRAQNISVKNVKKNRSTVLELKKFSMKKLDDGEFSMSALEEG